MLQKAAAPEARTGNRGRTGPVTAIDRACTPWEPLLPCSKSSCGMRTSAPRSTSTEMSSPTRWLRLTPLLVRNSTGEVSKSLPERQFSRTHLRYALARKPGQPDATRITRFERRKHCKRIHGSIHGPGYTEAMGLKRATPCRQDDGSPMTFMSSP